MKEKAKSLKSDRRQGRCAALAKMLRIAPVALLFMTILSLSCFPSPALADDLAKAEMGVNKMKASYPEPNSKIITPRPMITVDLSSLETPIDTASIVVLVNGADVTQSSDITASYIMYQPSGDLPPGGYEVRITARDVSQKDIEPLTWLFEITGAAGSHEVETEAAPSGKQAKSNSTGHLSVSTDYATANYVPSSVDTKSQFAEKEGMKLNTDLNFTNTSISRTLTGSYHRETQLYTDKEINKYRINYFDPKQEIAAGNFRIEMSNLTVVGTELAGVKIDEKFGRWNDTFFSGRTQDLKFDGTFRQMTTGFKSSFAWDRKNTSSLTFLDAYETNDQLLFDSGQRPAKDRIAAFMHEFKYSDGVRASLEVAGNRRQLYTGATSNGAARLFVSAELKKLSGEAEAYSIDRDFLPIAEGSSKYLNSNRKGYRGQGKYEINKWLSTGGEYEQYDSANLATATLPMFTTKRDNAFVALAPNGLPSLRGTYSKLTTSEGTVSKSENLMTSYTMKPTALLGETRVSYSLTKMNYSTIIDPVSKSQVLSTSKTNSYNLSSAYKDKLGINASYTQNRSLSASTPTLSTSISRNDSRDSIFSLNWNIVPFKFTWNGRYERVDNYGYDLISANINSDTRENRTRSMFRYAAGKKYSFSLGLDNINLKNKINSFYNYNENILRTGMDWQF